VRGKIENIENIKNIMRGKRNYTFPVYGLNKVITLLSLSLSAFLIDVQYENESV
jgi:hypothetical protein